MCPPHPEPPSHCPPHSIPLGCPRALAVTSTSGPGICLKSEAMNLAVIMELPLVVLDVQRGGPATGLPTKSEQTDLLQVTAQLACIRLMSGQVSRGSAGEYQADERPGVARLSWRVSGR